MIQPLAHAGNLTDKLAQKRQDAFISSEIFLLAALEEKGRLRDILKRAGILKEAVEKLILAVDERERKTRSAVARLEADFVRRLVEFGKNA